MSREGIEHVAHKSDDDRSFWLSCGDEEIARLTVSDPRMASAYLSLIQSFFDAALRAHAEIEHAAPTKDELGREEN